ncbi:CopG family transcriptional regulator [Glycomyces arizonensis]|uniref:ribbon-helix-helix domain-containing protein n=1 Tax=Glycomyces arizonensis TaxID=256035 RepID=UPI000427EEDE|nr:CopG family transcriptional regulator [Glycomyces arizonensis]
MKKTTVYFPEDLELRLEAEARRTGASQAELIRQAVAALLDHVESERELKPWPTFNFGGPMTLEEMDQAIYESIKRKVARR